MSRVKQLRTQLERRDIDAETERRMRNWARWRLGVPIGLAVSGAYDLEAPGRREETSIPLLNGEAMDVDKAVDELPEDLKAVVKEYWLRNGTVTQKAKACRCAIATFYRRLHQAHQRVHDHLEQLRARGARLRQAAAVVKPAPAAAASSDARERFYREAVAELVDKERALDKMG